MDAVWKWIDHNRFIVIGLIFCALLWFYAAGCAPETQDPRNPLQLVTVEQLQISFQQWENDQNIMAAKYDQAGKDLERQKEQTAALQDLILNLASGGAADLPGFLKLLIAGGGLGAIADNIRKRSLIAGLKRAAKK